MQKLYNPVAAHFAVGQWVAINQNGFTPYALGELVITRLSYSTAVVEIHYSKGGQKCVERDIHIPYEHLKR